ncbi:hypothetical protein [Haloferula sp.]|uniref:hypothetical protein n=1 Tax=Haloferula sp. TaxID=2497595 RepID=UPI003C736843
MIRSRTLRTSLLAIFSIAATTTASRGEESNDDSMVWLREETKRQIDGSRVQSNSGIWIQTPDGVGHYKALWVRDFYYQYQYAGEFLDEAECKAAMEYLFDGQREDGCMPDRVRADGVAVYSPGGLNDPMADHAVDNGPFMAMLVCEYVRRTKDLDFFNSVEDKLKKGMDFIHRSEKGMVYNSPDDPQCVYGFTDIVTKTGNLLFSSLLYLKSCEDLAACCEMSEVGNPDEYRRRADLIRKNLPTLWNDETGMFWAADKDCKQLDIWGSAYAIDVGVTTDKQRDRIVDYLIKHEDDIVQRGQIRHLPGQEVWQRLFRDNYPPGTYQNGAYWATPLAWIIPAVAQKNPETAWKWLRDAIKDSRDNGMAECINGSDRKVPNFVVSATNLHYAGRWLEEYAPEPTK